MRKKIKRVLTAVLTASLVLGCTGCSKEKKEPKPTPKATAKVDEGNANASGEGEGQADVPLVIACREFAKNFNPFSAESEADKQAVDLTQVKLVTNDRAGKILYKGIDGELREYYGENYTYYGATDLTIDYRKKSDTTKYQIKLRDDLVFSNGEKLTMDDVIFSMYVFLDNDYKGNASLKNMPIKGLLNYRANSKNAEKLSAKQVKRYVKKNPKELKKWIAKNITKQGITGEEAERLTEAQARVFLAQGKGKKVKNISGIRKVNDYELTIITNGYCKEMTEALQIPICALHYYGNTDKFNIEKNSFGFTRGDISSILANRTAPLGAGAYRFVKLEDNIAYFISNELYYLGCPQIAYLQLKDMTAVLEEAQKQLAAGGESDTETAMENSEKEELILPAEAKELKEGVVDVIAGSFTAEEVRQIMAVNSNGELSGNAFEVRQIADGDYHYIGIHGENVSVGKDAGSDASKNLRKALATLFAASRGVLKETEEALVSITNYPVAAESWVSPYVEDEDYSIAYSKDVSGKEIFEDDDTAEAKTELAKQIALEYFENAGYQTADGRVTAAPAGASLNYRVLVADGEANKLYPVIENAKAALEEIGITLQIQTVNEKELSKKLESGTQQIWVGSRAIKDMDMQTRYGIKEENLFGVSDKKLGKAVAKLQKKMTSEQRKEIYIKCFEGILEQAVEVPVCEFNNLTLFSSKRIDKDTIPKDCSPYYNWINEIQKVAMD